MKLPEGLRLNVLFPLQTAAPQVAPVDVPPARGRKKTAKKGCRQCPDPMNLKLVFSICVTGASTDFTKAERSSNFRRPSRCSMSILPNLYLFW